MSLFSALAFTKLWGIRFRTVVHVGAHLGEEIEEYRTAEWGTTATVWLEALPTLCEALGQSTSGLPNHRVINVALDNTCQEVDFYESTNDQASSLLRMTRHTDLYPDISLRSILRLRTERFDTLEVGHIDGPAIARLDVQGAELRVLEGFGDRLGSFSAVWAEYSTVALYEGSALLDDLDDFLASQGFRRVALIPYHATWGDGIWLREETVPSWMVLRRFLTRGVVWSNRVKAKIGYEIGKIASRKELS